MEEKDHFIPEMNNNKLAKFCSDSELDTLEILKPLKHNNNLENAGEFMEPEINETPDL